MSKRPHNEEKEVDLDGFQVTKVLMNEPHSKRVHILGKFPNSDDNAIITMVKAPFSEEIIPKILSLETTLEQEFSNDIYKKYEGLTKPSYNPISTQIIKPATQKHIDKFTAKPPHLLFETAEDYQNITLPYIEEQKFGLQWVYNILEHKSESERIVFEDPDQETGFVLLPDLKWDGKQVEDLYLVAIIHRRDIKSVRDLNEKHLPLLKNILHKGLEKIEKKYSVSASQMRVYFHYHPTYYHLHVHFNHLQYEISGTKAEKAHLLQDVINNIEEISSDYYAKKTLPIKLYETSPLLGLLRKDDATS